MKIFLFFSKIVRHIPTASDHSFANAYGFDPMRVQALFSSGGKRHFLMGREDKIKEQKGGAGYATKEKRA
ncbi:MAG: hypothetical protein IKM08_05930, partial [Clostridia bacterium]|nr:hypothetical protein [Clostridia bacterium]